MLTKSESLKKIFQIIGAITGLTALVIQFYLTVTNSHESGLSYLSGVIIFFSYNTILTNLLVLICFINLILKRNSMPSLFFSSSVVQTGILVYILIVGLVYHFVLASAWNPKGIALFADVLLHYVVPTFYFVYWLLFTEKGKQRYVNCFKWQIYPVTYVIYVLIRGEISGRYPYFFLEANVHGYGDVLVNIFFVAMGYVIVGAVVVSIDKLIFNLSKKNNN